MQLDTEKPVLICPEDIIRLPGKERSVPITWAQVIAHDNSGVVSVSSTHQSGQLFQVGMATLVTYEAIDVAGNIDNCTFVVSIKSK